MTAVSLDLPALHDGQLAIRNHKARFKVVRCGRRFGKTTLAAVMCVEVALGVAYWHHKCHPDEHGRPRPGRVWWVPPTYKPAKIGWRVVLGLARILRSAGVDVTVNLGDWTLDFPNGGQIVVRSGDSSSGLRGEGLDFLVLEEAALIGEEAWYEDLRPALMDRQGEAMFITTPRGYNWFFDLEEQARRRDGWATFHAPSSANPYLDVDEVLELAAEVGPAAYAQEVLAEYIDSGMQPFRRAWFKYFRPGPDVDGRRTIMAGDRTLILEDAVRYATVDLAVSTKTSADYTAIAVAAFWPEHGVLAILDLVRDRIPAPDLTPTLEGLVSKHDLRWVGIERAGYQLAAVQIARRAGLAVRELPADRDKLARSVPLQVRMEAGDVYFPAEAAWLTDVESELVKFPDGEHDDAVDALAYAAIDAGRMPGYDNY